MPLLTPRQLIGRRISSLVVRDVSVDAVLHNRIAFEAIPDSLSYCLFGTRRIAEAADGRDMDHIASLREEWHAIIRGAVAAGKEMSRVHVVPHVLTSYVGYELEWGYLYNAEAGERIMLLRHDAPAAFRPGWTAHDFWLFDSSVAVRMHYDANGTYLHPELITDNYEVQQYCRVRGEAIARAVTLQAYWPRSEIRERGGPTRPPDPAAEQDRTRADLGVRLRERLLSREERGASGPHLRGDVGVRLELV